MNYESKYEWPKNQLLPTGNTPAGELDLVQTTNLSEDEKTLLAGLKGIINRSVPRIFSTRHENGSGQEWTDVLGLAGRESHFMMQF